MKRRAVLCALLASMLGFAGIVVGESPALASSITEYPVTTPNSGPSAIAMGPDGNLWFTEDANAIGRITTKGVVTEFPIPTSDSDPSGITPGADGNIWFTERVGNNIGRITPTGTITEFPIPTSNSGPVGIVEGSDGNLWFTEFNTGKIGRITTKGKIKEFQIQTKLSEPFGIAAGSDGNLWFTESGADQIGQITTGGAITEFPISGPGTLPPLGITGGSDGNLWFTLGGYLGRITTGGAITEFPTISPDSIVGIADGPDGALWFTETGDDNIGRSTTGGVVSETPIPTVNSSPEGIAAGPDGNIWFAEDFGNNIGVLRASGPSILNVFYIPNFFVKKVAPLRSQGETVSWLMMNPGLHGIADSTGMQLFGFGPSGGPSPVPMGEQSSFTFEWAGIYAYGDPFHPSSKGKVRVPMDVQLVPGTTDQARVAWAAGDAPGGFVFDVQVKQPGAPGYLDWRVGTTALNGVFGPGDPMWAGPGTYSFRARLRQLGTDRAAAFSAGKPIALA